MYKIIFSDLDGTLLNYFDKKTFVSDKNLKAINSWLEENNYFSIATGRNIGSINRFLEKNMINFNLPLVLANGALVYNHKKDEILYEKILDLRIIDEFINYFENISDAVLLLIESRKHFILGAENKSYLDEINLKYPVVDKNFIKNLKIIKIGIIVKKEKSDEIREKIQKFGCFSLLNLIPSAPTYIEIVDKNISKMTGIKKALAFAGINKHQIYTIGDYLNDYEMIKQADFGFAPNNAHVKILKIAKFIVSNHNEDAISDMISKIRNLNL